MSGETKVLYDVRTAGAPVGGTLAGGAGGALVGALLLAIVWKRPERAARVFAVLWIVGWGGLSAWSALGIAARHREAAGWLDAGKAEVVEGTVENLSPANEDRAGIETFHVGGRLFRFEDGRAAVPGLNRSSVRGGPVRAGAKVRLHVHGPSILRVEELAPPPKPAPSR